MLNIVLFGYGRAGKIHYKNIIDNDNINLKYLIEIKDISNEIRNSVKYVNYSEKNKINEILLDKNIDAFIITSPTNTHYELIMLALNHLIKILIL